MVIVGKPFGGLTMGPGRRLVRAVLEWQWLAIPLRLRWSLVRIVPHHPQVRQHRQQAGTVQPAAAVPAIEPL